MAVSNAGTVGPVTKAVSKRTELRLLLGRHSFLARSSTKAESTDISALTSLRASRCCQTAILSYKCFSIARTGVSVWAHEASESGTTRLTQRTESVTVEDQVLLASAAGALKLSILRWLLAELSVGHLKGEFLMEH